MYAEIVLPIPVDRSFHYHVPAEMESEIRIGQRVRVPFGKRQAIGYVINIFETAPAREVKEITSSYSPELSLSEDLLNLGKWISQHYACPLGESLTAILPTALRQPLRKSKQVTEIYHDEPTFSPSYKLTKEQTVAVDKICEQLSAKQHCTFLLHGVTASGKTEVYFQAIERCLKNNQEVIYLLPEISLTPQFVELTQKRFGKNAVSLWHSRLSMGARYETFIKAIRGEIKILLGARSALFAPFKNLALIVIDEEHEFTYKQEQKPLYNSREVAIKRAQLNNAIVVLGSATPSMESNFRATQEKQYVLLELKERIEQRMLAPIQIVDMRDKKPAEKNKIKSRIFSQELLDSLQECLEKKQQAILFLNRRGFSTFLTCSRCGYVAKCPVCLISLVYHRTGDILRCHFCRHQEPVPLTCPSCKSIQLHFGGAGTEKVETEIQKIFPLARIQRMDMDTTRNKDLYHETYHAIKDEKIDILIGTQMIAKGFDFPKVTLVGIINADTTLYLPDFRAAERTFQLVTQVSGRAGRGTEGGKVVLQTQCPDHYVFLKAKTHSYHQFYNEEIKLRKELNYPPFTDLVRIIFRSINEKEVKTIADEYTLQIKNMLSLLGLTQKVAVLGPAPTVYLLIGGKYRWHLFLKGSGNDLEKLIENLRVEPGRKGVQISYDIDPVDVL